MTRALMTIILAGFMVNFFAALPVTRADELPPPILIEPKNEARYSSYSALPVCRWNYLDGAASYQIELGLDPDFNVSSGAISLSGNTFRFSDYMSTDSWTSLSLLLYWRVRGVDATTLPGQWSEVWSFHKTNLMAPRITSPETGSSYGAGQRAPTIAWEYLGDESPMFYIVEIDSDNVAYNGYLARLECWDQDVLALDLGQLIAQSQWDPVSYTFYFRVWAVDQDRHYGPLSTTRYFYKSAVPAPRLYSPADWQTYEMWSQPATLTWEAIAGSSGDYTVQFGTDGDFTEILFEITVSNTTLNFSDYIDRYEWADVVMSFHWRVCTYDFNQTKGPYSSSRTFLKLGQNRVMCYGDSITGGYGSSSWTQKYPDVWGDNMAGYPLALEPLLHDAHFNPDSVDIVYWIPGGHAFEGADQIYTAIAQFCPNFVLVQYGIVDVIDPYDCPDHTCHTVNDLRDIIGSIRNVGIQPILGSLIPTNPASPNPQSTAWEQEILDLNPDIIDMAQSENVPYVDLYSYFVDHAPDGNLAALYSDYDTIGVHPGDLGYEVMAQGFFEVLQPYLQQ